MGFSFGTKKVGAQAVTARLEGHLPEEIAITVTNRAVAAVNFGRDTNGGCHHAAVAVRGGHVGDFGAL